MTYVLVRRAARQGGQARFGELRKFVKTEMTSVADKVTVEDSFPAVEPYV